MLFVKSTQQLTAKGQPHKMQWIPLNSIAQIADICKVSAKQPCLIFKHSTRCTLSMIARMRLEEEWDFEQDENKAYLLDLLTFPEVSAQVAETFSVYHESPQLLLIRNGECTYEAAKEEISVADLRECYNDDFW